MYTWEQLRFDARISDLKRIAEEEKIDISKINQFDYRGSGDYRKGLAIKISETLGIEIPRFKIKKECISE